ncbi:hypothetical protein FNO01nite_01410 [Flavobacterium noncentrifugens]|uniref:TonB-dependent Receptor Plug Domain n=1 Tax=Flavobacterium noncentrifugens TaxID=1128970 RepID=A0A1G8RK76_9FLAO|nr:hypothetical protein [Flavobacterium noncentrifugens]GEP49469.1 hypothetical protein FNO01nite_01410 [Flavobacterium noncentrifugens]SDJ17351.1 hypothetical protein SAMN04487935_0160 [Flavobacterium noncentrifugens]
MKKYIFLLFSIVLNLGVQAQQTQILNSSDTAERIFIAANATSFISGETLYCKLFCINPVEYINSKISNIAYVELIGSNKKTVVRQKFYLQDGTADGSIFIPATFESGNYKLIAYTQWMLNESATNFYQMDITVINPFAVIKNPLNPASEKPASTAQVAVEKNAIQIKTDKKTYAAREKAIINITAPEGHFMASIRKIDGILQKKQTIASEFHNAISANNTATIKSGRPLPELRGELVTGHITSKNLDVKNKTVALTIREKSFEFKLVKTDAAGKFTFMLDHQPLNPEAVIQVFEDNRSDFTVVLDELQHPDLSQLNFPAGLNISASDKESIEQRSIAAQIENAYYNRKKDSLQAQIVTPTFYNSFEKEYILDDYTRFPTVRETITEILKEVDYSKNRKGYTVFLRNYTSEIDVYGPPLILIDGLPVQDLNELFDFPANDIKKVGIINNGYIYGPKTFSGVISFVTKNNDYEPKINAGYISKTTLLRPLRQKIYYNPDYSGDNKSIRIPDYRQQLLWIPDLKTEHQEETLSCYTSDVTGTFEITIEGITNGGEAYFATKTFEVK